MSVNFEYLISEDKSPMLVYADGRGMAVTSQISKELCEFAVLMQHKLTMRSERYPNQEWKSMDLADLQLHLIDEFNEYLTSISRGEYSDAVYELVDLANMAMFMSLRLMEERHG